MNWGDWQEPANDSNRFARNACSTQLRQITLYSLNGTVVWAVYTVNEEVKQLLTAYLDVGCLLFKSNSMDAMLDVFMWKWISIYL